LATVPQTHTHTHTHIFIIPITTASTWTKFRRVTLKMKVVLSAAKQVKCTAWCRNPKYDYCLKEAYCTVHSPIFESPVLIKSPKQETLKSCVGHFKIGGQVFSTVKYADDRVILAKEETVLHGVINRLIETGKFYGLEMNLEKNKVISILRQYRL
jgi:hypothetical protein